MVFLAMTCEQVTIKDTYKVSSLGVLDGFSVTDRNSSSLSFNCGIQESYIKKVMFILNVVLGNNVAYVIISWQ